MEINLNNLLKRQIKKHFGSIDNLPTELKNIISDINETYNGFDEDTRLIQNSIEISSQELRDAFHKQKQDAAVQKETIRKIKEAISALNTTGQNSEIESESDILDSNSIEEKVHIKNYVLTHSKNLRPSVTLSMCINGEFFEEHAQGDGQYDAFVNALYKIYDQKKIVLPILVDYAVRIPPGGKSDALCETIITWSHNNKEFKTRGLDSDQTVAAIKATEKMLNQI